VHVSVTRFFALGAMVGASACTEHRTLDPRPDVEIGIATAAAHARGYEVPIESREDPSLPKLRQRPDMVMPDDPFGAPPMGSHDVPGHPLHPDTHPSASAIPAPPPPTGKAL
jgi:hypothetical protein